MNIFRKVITYINQQNHVGTGSQITNRGYCVICEKETIFTAWDPWLRDHYLCNECQSIPRQRALINTLNLFCPGYKDLVIHESSPAGPSSEYLKNKCSNYSASFYFTNQELGSFYNGHRCENLEYLTFENQSFDLIITQDVLEHVMHPERVFKEIGRVLKNGGSHIFSVPWYPYHDRSNKRADIQDGEIIYLDEPIYHGNPIDKKGSLVTYDWGEDLPDHIYRASRMLTTVYLHRDRALGLDGEFLHIFISKKRSCND